MRFPLPPHIDESEKQNAAQRIAQADLDNARNNRDIWSNGEWLERFEHDTIRAAPKVTLGQGVCFLGHTDLDYRPDNVFGIELPYTRVEGGNIVSNRQSILIMGGAGTGKTAVADKIERDYAIRLYGMPWIEIDPNPTPESWIARFAVTSQQIPHPPGAPDSAQVARLREYFSWAPAGEPMGFPNIEYKPRIGSQLREEGIDKIISLGLQDFRDAYFFDPTEGKQLLCDAADMSNSKPARTLAGKILRSENIKNISGAITALRERSFSDNADFDSQEKDKTPIGKTFANYLEAALDEGLLSDEPQPDPVADLQKVKFVALRHRMQTSKKESPMQRQINMFAKVFPTKFLNERDRYVNGIPEEKAKSRMNHPAGYGFKLEEAKSIMPNDENSYTLRMAENFASTDRKKGGSVIAITQNVAEISPTFAAQVDKVIFSAPDNPENLNYLAGLGIPAQLLEKWKRTMLTKQRNSLGYIVSQFRVFDRNTKRWTEPFYVAPKLEAHKGA